MPWKNGGGMTTEIHVHPGDDGRFAHRISVADVTADGPFSRFDGDDRHIVVLDGAGMTLDCGAHGRLELRPLEPVAFSGDWDVAGTLVAGPVRDFNVIVDRARASADLVVRTIARPLEIELQGAATCIVHVLSGDLGIAAAGETIVADASFAMDPRADTRLVVATIRPRTRP